MRYSIFFFFSVDFLFYLLFTLKCTIEFTNVVEKDEIVWKIFRTLKKRKIGKALNELIDILFLSFSFSFFLCECICMCRSVYVYMYCGRVHTFQIELFHITEWKSFGLKLFEKTNFWTKFNVLLTLNSVNSSISNVFIALSTIYTTRYVNYLLFWIYIHRKSMI